VPISENSIENTNESSSQQSKVKDEIYALEKRKRNTEASARFRARKKQEAQAIHTLCQQLENDNNKLKYRLLMSDKKIQW